MVSRTVGWMWLAVAVGTGCASAKPSVTVVEASGPAAVAVVRAEAERTPVPASLAGPLELAQVTDAEAGPVLTDTGFVVQASQVGSLTLVAGPRTGPVGVWIECSYFAVASIDAPVDVVSNPAIPRVGAAYSLWCWYEPDGVVVPSYPVIVLFDPLEPAPGLVDVIDVAEFAQSQIDFEPPGLELSPSARQVVGVETWLAVVSELEYPDVTAQAGLAWATVRTTFRDVVWSLGDGSTLTCSDDATTTWNRSTPLDEQTSDCTHTYVDSSAATGYQATATVTWSLEWINNDAPDEFVPWATLSLASPLTVYVDQLQAVIR